MCLQIATPVELGLQEISYILLSIGILFSVAKIRGQSLSLGSALIEKSYHLNCQGHLVLYGPSRHQQIFTIRHNVTSHKMWPPHHTINIPTSNGKLLLGKLPVLHLIRAFP